MQTVKLYCFVLSIAGSQYAGQVPATSFDEAKALVPHGTDWGELVEEQPVGQICSICTGQMRIDLTEPKAIDDKWPDAIS